MELEIFYFVQYWFEDKDSARVYGFFMTSCSIRTDRQSYTRTRGVRRQNLENMRKAHRILQSWTQRMARADLWTKRRLWICELPDSPDSSYYAPSSNESDDDFDYEAPIDRVDQRDQLIQTGSSTTTPSWANRSWSQTDQSWQGRWQYFSWRHSQDLRNPSEYHNWRWPP